MSHKANSVGVLYSLLCGAGCAVVFVAGGCAALSGRPAVSLDADSLIQEARSYLDQGLTDSALAAFGMALEADPTLLEAHMSMGAIYRQHGNYELAGRCYRRAISVDPHSFDARYSHGWMEHLLGRIESAVESYLHALSIRPDSFDTNLNLAGAYLQLGRPAEAMPYASRAADLGPDSQAAWANLATVHSLLGQYEDAIGAYHQAMELGELAEPILLGLADAHMRLGRFEQAVVVLRQVNSRSPSPLAYQRMGYAQFKLRRFESSLESFRAALQHDGEDPLTLNGVGVCLMAIYLENGRGAPQRRDEALDVWRRSLQLRHNQPHISDLLARYQRL